MGEGSQCVDSRGEDSFLNAESTCLELHVAEAEVSEGLLSVLVSALGQGCCPAPPNPGAALWVAYFQVRSFG